MSYKDDDGRIVFPTRAGSARGASFERKMIDSVGGSGGIRRAVRLNPDGTTTRLVTRAGNPDFITSGGGKPLCWLYETVSNRGFIDTTYNFMGVGDDSNEPIRSLVNRDGSIPPDNEVFIRNSHSWKANFLYGEAFGSELNYGGLPSNFSGAMRRLMQVYHGTLTDKKTSQYEVEPGEECPPAPRKQPFSCTYAKTHGVFFASSGKRWVIEISSAGIFRVDVSFVREFSSPSYQGEETDEDVAKEFWTLTDVDWEGKTQIGSAPESYADGFAPWYSWCGWAFNSTGTAATNVVFKDHPSWANWLQAAMFDITISASGDVPAYVTCTLTETANLASPIRDTHDGDTANIQRPIDVPGLCYTVPIYASGASGVDSPVFSFYEGEAKRVYRFVTYGSTAAPTSPINTNGDPQTFTGAKLGEMTAFADLAPATLETQTQGIRSQTHSGTSGGGVGFTGEGFPGQNVDLNVSETTLEHEIGPSGFAIDGPYSGTLYGCPPAFHYTMRVEIAISADGLSQTVGNTVIKTPSLSGLPSGYVFLYPVQARYSVSSTSHSKQITHKSTLILNGYDRESISLAFSKDTYTGAYTRSAAWTTNRMVVVRGEPQWGGPGMPTSTYTIGLGSKDSMVMSSTIQFRYGPGYILIEQHPSDIIGCYDASNFPGAVASLSGTIRSIDGTPITIPDINEYVPASDVTSWMLYSRVGRENVVSTISSQKVHTTNTEEASFSLYLGASAFSFEGVAYFYSEDADLKPKLVGLGSRLYAQNRLYGFIGAF